MSLTTTLHTSLTGLSTSSQMLNVAGNNIANANTYGFKRSRISFQTSIQQNLRSGSAPTGDLGGSNPAQVGLGAQLASIMRDFSSGSLQPTGVNTDMAIEGDGFFVVRNGDRQFYSRSGHFDLDRDFNLVTPGGAKVQGFGIDNDFKIVPGVLQTLNIPLGNMTLAEATTSVSLSGNLNASGDVATQGSINSTAPLYSDAGATTPATAGTALTSLYNADGDPLFTAGDVISLFEATRGGAKLPTTTFLVGAAADPAYDANGTDLQSLMDFLEGSLGIETSVSGGLSINGTGQLVIEGNSGTANDLVLDTGNLVVNMGSGASLPFEFTQDQEADGESVRTTFAAYDSLGNVMTVDVSMVLESKGDAGTEWRFYVQSDDDSDLSRALGTGLLTFGPSGRIIGDTDPAFTIDRVGTGAIPQQQITLDFASENGSLSALGDLNSRLVTLDQDGAAIGTLADFSVMEDGTIMGIFTNSLLRPLGQVAMANFSNPQGLVEVGSNMYDVTTNSGAAQIGIPTQGGLGRIVGSALEQSNVDLSEEFVNLISASTGFSASSRVLTTSDQLMQELLNIVR